MIRLDPKLPTEVRTYRHDWSAFLGADDTIATQTTVSSDVTIDSSAPTSDNLSVTFKVSGGTLGTTAAITQTITTGAGLEETETFELPIAPDEPVSLTDAKAYLRVLTSDEDAKIAAMIPRARKWVEDHTGLALVQRQFEERLRPARFGAMHLSYGPLVSVDSVSYLDGQGSTQVYAPRAYPPLTDVYPDDETTWPVLDRYGAFDVTYTAGDPNPDERLIGAMLALIAGEFDTGQAYPDTAISAAENCCAYLRTVVA